MRPVRGMERDMRPGTNAAKMMGCTCDHIVNNGGLGNPYGDPPWSGGRFVVDATCNIHGATVWGANHRSGLPTFRSELTDDERYTILHGAGNTP